MRKVVILLAFVLCLATESFGQVYIGLRDNQYVNLGYVLKEKWNFKLEHSVFNDSFENQYIRGYIEYNDSIDAVEYSVMPFYGMTYNNSFYNTGIYIGAKYRPLSWLGVKVGVAPFYDSFFKYKTNYLMGLDFNVWPNLYILGGVSNFPEYRESQHKAYLGLSIQYKNLKVSPRITIPIESTSTKRNIRVLMSFSFMFRR